MLKAAFSLVTTSNGCIRHYKFDLNVKKAMFLSSFKISLPLKINEFCKNLIIHDAKGVRQNKECYIFINHVFFVYLLFNWSRDEVITPYLPRPQSPRAHSKRISGARGMKGRENPSYFFLPISPRLRISPFNKSLLALLARSHAISDSSSFIPVKIPKKSLWRRQG